jgi:L,D-transpeptidase catalytic domain
MKSMKKKIQHLFSQEKRIAYTLVGVFFLLLCHTLLFFGHQFLVYRYDVLYEEATGEGTLVTMPADFQQMQSVAGKRAFLTRPDTLFREAIALQTGVRSLISQYRNDFYRMRDTIVSNLQSLRTIVELSEEFVFPEREEVNHRANYLEGRLNMNKDERIESLEDLVKSSVQYVEKASEDLERTMKSLVLQDIVSLKHEITFLDSIYRVSPGMTLKFDVQIFNKLYLESFSEDKLLQKSDDLRSSWTTLSNLLNPYRIESREVRRIAREKRADIVAEEAKKWIDKKPPEAPFPAIFDQIFVSLSEQMMYVYEDGELIMSTPITSGRQNFQTVRWTFKIYTKQRNKLMKSPFPDEEYELWVDYWMGFYGAYGIHDTCNSRDCWRTKYGWPSYIYNGSHGCINTPYNAVRLIYNWARIGTTVHVK